MIKHVLRGTLLAVAVGQGALADEVFEFSDVEPAAQRELAAVPLQPVAAALEANDPQLVAMLEQLRPTLAVEVSFAKRAAKLSPEQVGKLVEGCGGPLRAVARKFAQNQNGMQGVMFMAHGGGGQPARNQQPDEMLEQLVAAQVRLIADDEQQQLYTKEIEAREEFRKVAALDQLLSMYDDALVFTPEQREKVRKSLARQYKPSWSDNVEAIAQFSDGYFPVVPDGAVTPHLNAAQRKVWQRLQKVSASMGMGNNMWGSTPIDDVDLAPLAAADDEQVKK